MFKLTISDPPRDAPSIWKDEQVSQGVTKHTSYDGYGLAYAENRGWNLDPNPFVNPNQAVKSLSGADETLQIDIKDSIRSIFTEHYWRKFGFVTFLQRKGYGNHIDFAAKVKSEERPARSENWQAWAESNTRGELDVSDSSDGLEAGD